MTAGSRTFRFKFGRIISKHFCLVLFLKKKNTPERARLLAIRLYESLYGWVMCLLLVIHTYLQAYHILCYDRHISARLYIIQPKSFFFCVCYLFTIFCYFVFVCLFFFAIFDRQCRVSVYSYCDKAENSSKKIDE